MIKLIKSWAKIINKQNVKKFNKESLILMRLAVCVMKLCYRMIIWHFVSLAVAEIFTQNVWKGGSNIKFQIIRKYLVQCAEWIGVKTLSKI